MEDFNKLVHERRMKRIEKLKQKYEYKAEEDKILKSFKKDKKHIPASKVFLVIILLISIEIILYSEYVMIAYQNLSSLYTLIGIPASLVAITGTIIGYFNKSAKENTEGGIVYDSMMYEHDHTCGGNSDCVDPSSTNE